MSKQPKMTTMLPDVVSKRDLQSVYVSIVMPAHNEAAGLPKAVLTLSNVLSDCVADWEIVIVDDGSADGTFDAISALAAGDTRVKGLQLSRNFGKEAALLCGLKAAAGDVVITIDSDLQHPPKLIPALLEEWRKGAMVVHAV